MSVCVTLKNVDLVFGRSPSQAFAAIDEGKTRLEIRNQTQLVVGVQGINLEVQKGEILCLMGLSGSGKSSLLRCINGMNGRGQGSIRGQVRVTDPTSGREFDVVRCKKSELRDLRKHCVSMVFQQFGLMPWKTVEQNIAFPLEICGLSKKQIQPRVEEQIQLVGLGNWAKSYPSELSGGMQQRVGLARAFVTGASILLMDEPFSALDPLHRKHLQDEVLSLQEKLKKTVVFVTHDLQEAMRVSNRIALMEQGQILQIGTAQELIENPVSPRVQEFTSSVSTGHH